MGEHNSSNGIPDNGTIALGIDLGSHSIRLGAVDSRNVVTTFRTEPYTEESKRDARCLVDQVVETALRFFTEQSAKSGQPGSGLRAIGVAIPGLVHRPDQRILSVSHLPDLSGIDLRKELERACGRPVYLENNANAAACAEMHRGVAKGLPNWLYLHIGANVGAGLVLEGRIQHGKSGLAGSIGRMNIYVEHLAASIQLEDQVSARNIVRRTRLRLQRDKTSSLSRLAARGGFSYDDIIDCAHDGDELSRMMLDRTGAFISIAIADIISLLNLSMIAVGGAIPARRFLSDAIAKGVRARTMKEFSDDCEIVPAEVGVEATVLGVAIMAGGI